MRPTSKCVTRAWYEDLRGLNTVTKSTAACSDLIISACGLATRSVPAITSTSCSFCSSSFLWSSSALLFTSKVSRATVCQKIHERQLTHLSRSSSVAVHRWHDLDRDAHSKCVPIPHGTVHCDLCNPWLVADPAFVATTPQHLRRSHCLRKNGHSQKIRGTDAPLQIWREQRLR